MIRICQRERLGFYVVTSPPLMQAQAIDVPLKTPAPYILEFTAEADQHILSLLRMNGIERCLHRVLDGIHHTRTLHQCYGAVLHRCSHGNKKP